MEGEFNNLNINNTNITFNNTPNNIETSDELKAPLMYQDNIQGTNFARKKRTAKIVVLSGITMLVTAASIASGSIISNAFILNPPKISDSVYKVEEEVFTYNFTVTNEGEYKLEYFITIGDRTLMKSDCSKSGTYAGQFNENKDLMLDNYVAVFHIKFTNQFDYSKQLVEVKFKTGGIV